MIICLCRRVSDRDIACAVREGCDSFDELQVETGVATACGCCHDCARHTFDQHLAAAPLTAAAGRPAAVVMHRSVARAASAIAA